MANVGFKIGSSTNLYSLTSANLQEGTFYVTNDTNRFYLGVKNGSQTALAPLNGDVVVVASEAVRNGLLGQGRLDGKLYYSLQEKSLAYYNAGTWEVINSVVTISSISPEIEINTDDNSATLGLTFTDSNGGNVESKKFSFKGQNGITLSQTEDKTDELIISGEIATIEAKDSSIVLTHGDETSTIGLIGDNVTIEASNNNITFSVDPIKDLEYVAQSDGGFKPTFTTKAGNEIVGTELFNPQIKLNSDSSSTISFVDGIATLNVYSREDIDNSLRTLNAVEYRGIVTDWNNLKEKEEKNTQIKNGYAYLISGDNFKVDEGTEDEVFMPAGTLVIASGTEESNGYIASTNINWQYVTGSQIDTRYKQDFGLDYGFYLKEENGNNVFGFELDTDESLALGQATSNNIKTVTVKHNDKYLSTDVDISIPVVSMSPNVELNVPIISKITRDQGHITGIDTTSVTFTDTYSEIKTYETAFKQDNSNEIQVKTSLQLKNSNGSDIGEASTASFGIKSESLSLAKDDENKNISIELTWGSF